MAKKDFCGVQTLQVLIPYSDLENLLNIARKLPELETQMKRMEIRNAAMAMQYTELLEKVAEINRYL